MLSALEARDFDVRFRFRRTNEVVEVGNGPRTAKWFFSSVSQIVPLVRIIGEYSYDPADPK